jgi:hypothetical protein
MKTALSERSVRLVVLTAASAVALAAAAHADAGTYGKLIARHQAAPSASLQTSFAGPPPPRAFLLVVTEPSGAPLDLSWSVRCVGHGPSRRESGGAAGAATVSGGRWVKRVATTWIEHPTSCVGSIAGSAAASPVLVRVFTQ